MNKVRPLLKMFWLSAVLLAFGHPLGTRAATANIIVGSGGSFSFSPAVTNIHAGDRVVWTWAGNNHNVTSLTSAWTASATQNAGALFTNTFNSTGTFPYECTIHAAEHMTGAVVVAVAVLPPTVAITNPASGAVFAAPANVTIQATATGNGATVTNVQFFADAASLGNVTAAPYSATASNLAAGSHALSAVATDTNGSHATNSVSISVVNPAPIQLSALQRTPPATFQFSYTANAGLSYVVQRSTNLALPDWVPLATNTAAGSPVNFTDLNAIANHGFYRVGLMPNP